MALEAERQRYQELFEFAPDAYLVTSMAGNIQEANGRAAALLGVPPRFLTGKPLLVFIVSEERAAFHTQLETLREVDHVLEWEVRLTPRKRPPIAAAVTVASVKDTGGQPVALRWLIRDITERKRIEHVARGQAEALAHMLNALMAQPDLDTFLEQVLMAIAEQLKPALAALWFYDARQDTLSLQLIFEGGRVDHRARPICPDSIRPLRPRCGRRCSALVVPSWSRTCHGIPG